MEFYVPYPDKQVFKKKRNDTRNATLPSGNKIVYELDRVEYPETGGILVYKKELLYPTKGMVYPEAIRAIHMPKKIFIEVLHMLNYWVWKLVLILFVLSPFKSKIKKLNRVLSFYCSTIWSEVENHVIDDHRLTPVARELKKFLETFLTDLGVAHENIQGISTIFSTIFEYDDAYRYRLQDICSETSSEKIKNNPSKEITRLVQIYCEREEADVLKEKVQNLEKAISILFKSKRFAQAFFKALDSITFSGLQYDDIDTYNILQRGNYNFQGRTWEQRQEEWSAIHNGKIPVPFIIQ